MDNTYIKTTNKKGRGVFANKNYKKSEIIEVCPVVILPKKDIKFVNKTILFNYYFGWGNKDDHAAIALGFGSLYNHSYNPNAIYEKYFSSSTIHFRAIKNIKRDEEITVNYNGDPKNKKPLWFKAKPLNNQDEYLKLCRILNSNQESF